MSTFDDELEDPVVELQFYKNALRLAVEARDEGVRLLRAFKEEDWKTKAEFRELYDAREEFLAKHPPD